MIQNFKNKNTLVTSDVSFNNEIVLVSVLVIWKGKNSVSVKPQLPIFEGFFGSRNGFFESILVPENI